MESRVPPCEPRPSGRRAGSLPGQVLLLVLVAIWAGPPDSAWAAQGVGEPATAEGEEAEEGSGTFASPYLPLGHWAYDVLDFWIPGGGVAGLSPQTRPYRRTEVARALLALEREGLPPGATGHLRALEGEFRSELAALRGEPQAGDLLWLDLGVGGRLVSQTHPDPLRPELDGPFSRTRFLERAEGSVKGRMGNVAAGVTVGRSGLHRHDPRFPDGRVLLREGEAFLTELELRVDEAYVEVQGRRARLSLGRRLRNWGAPGAHGLLRSDGAYSFDEVSYRFGSDRLFLVGAVTALPDMAGDTARFFSSHRLEFHIRPDLVLAVSEAALHGGPGSRLDPRLLSPLAIWELTRDSERTTQSNVLAQLDLWWRPMPGLVLFGSLLGDSPPGIGACCETGGMVGVEYASPSSGTLIRARVTAIESLVYRTRRPWEEYSFQGLGLGWDKADLIAATVEAGWLARGGLLLRPRLDLQLLGEESRFQGALRPGQAGLEEQSGILTGRHEITLRPSLSGLWRPGDRPHARVEWDLGLNHIRHVAHEAGVQRTLFVGSVALSLQPPRIGILSGDVP